jgi:hypothetical protein
MHTSMREDMNLYHLDTKNSFPLLQVLYCTTSTCSKDLIVTFPMHGAAAGYFEHLILCQPELLQLLRVSSTCTYGSVAATNNL